MTTTTPRRGLRALLAAITAAGAVLVGSAAAILPAAAAVEPVTFTVVFSDFVGPADGSSWVGVGRLIGSATAGVDYPAEAIGRTCSVDFVTRNGESVHVNNYAQAVTNGDTVTLTGTEDGRNGVHQSTSTVTLGAVVEVWNYLGARALGELPAGSSFEGSAVFTCPPGPDETTTTTTAPTTTTTAPTTTTTPPATTTTTAPTTTTTEPPATTTTTTPPATTTTTAPTTTTTEPPATTTTTTPPATTTTTAPTTTTTEPPTTTTTEPPATTTTTTPTETTIPFTGLYAAALGGSGLALLAAGTLGLALTRSGRHSRKGLR